MASYILLRSGTVTYSIVYVHKCAHVPQFLLEVGTGAYEGKYIPKNILMIARTCSNILSTITPVHIQVDTHNTALHSV